MEIISEEYNFEELGVDSVNYYYHTYPGIDNCFTACVLFDNEKNLISRGVSICSLLDTHNKKIGRRNALGRAVRAIRSGRNSSPIDLSLGSRNTQYIKMKCDVTDKDSEFITAIRDEAINEEICVTEVKKEGKPIRTVLEFSYPFILPIEHTELFFKYKSELYPVPTEYEEDVLGAKEIIEDDN